MQLTPDGSFRRQKTVPRNRLDLRRRAGLDMDQIYDALTGHQIRHARPPAAIRLAHDDWDRIGRPTALFGIKVTQ